MVFWHSSAHVLGEACELHYGCNLCIGPPIEEGFYYEMGTMLDGRAVSQTDYSALETLASRAIKEKQPFERLMMTKDQLLEMFKVLPFLSFSPLFPLLFLLKLLFLVCFSITNISCILSMIRFLMARARLCTDVVP
jgi:hypothetical protein